MAKIPSKPWGGRFSEPTNEFVERFSASVEIDHRLYAYDILGSQAHAEMLSKIGVLTDSEFGAINDGLNKIREEIEADNFNWTGIVSRESASDACPQNAGSTLLQAIEHLPPGCLSGRGGAPAYIRRP